MTNLSFLILFTANIVGAARATKNPHNICLSGLLAPIMKFPTSVTQAMISYEIYAECLHWVSQA